MTHEARKARRSWLGVGADGPDDELLVGVGCHGKGLPVEGDFADEGVMDGLDACCLGGDVVGSPPLAEVLVLDRQFTDEFAELRVVRVAGNPQRTSAPAPQVQILRAGQGGSSSAGTRP